MAGRGRPAVKPFRFIIAAAKIHGCPVVTSDERFSHYGIKTIL
jgi:hypothetical protein